MGKKSPKLKKPRYITIRIQYYPIPKFFYNALYFVGLILFLTLAVWNEKPIVYKVSDEIFRYPFITIDETPSLLSEQVIFHGDRMKKEIALTFDADMTPSMKSLVEQGKVASYYDKRIIDTLNSTQTKATLFLSGMWIEMYKNETKELAENSLFELASHSYSHPSFHGTCYGLSQITDNQDQEEIQKTQDLLQEVTGVTNTLFRFPGGCYDQSDITTLYKNNLTAIQWDVAGLDGFNENVESIENNILHRIQNGSIIVLHMHGGPNAPKTADALPVIIASLKEKGYQFVTVSELLEKKETNQAFDLKQLISYSQ